MTVTIVLIILFIILILCYDLSLKAMAENVQSAYENIPKPEIKKERKNRKAKVSDDNDSSTTQHEDLDDLYISDHGCLSQEYSGTTASWDIEPTAEQLATQKIKQEQLNKLSQQKEEPEEVPFELVNQQASMPEQNMDLSLIHI